MIAATTRGLGVARLVATASAALALAACGVIPPPPPALPPTDIPHAQPSPVAGGPVTSDGFSPAQHTAVRLRVETCDEFLNGSGFILDESHVITNRHVVEGALHIEVTTYDGRDFVATGSEVAEVADLAIVDLEPVFSEFVTLADVKPETGSPIAVVGYPQGQALVVENGFYNGIEKDSVAGSDEFVYTLRAKSKPGSSGSAVFDAEGNVVGILYAGNDGAVSLAWPVQWLKDQLAAPETWKENHGSC